MHPDDKEAAICSAELRIRRAVQQDEDERWKKRIATEDKITTNAIETLRSDFNKMSAKMADEVVSLKNRHQGSAASTVSGSTVSGGGGVQLCAQDGATHVRGLPSRTQRMVQLEKHSWDGITMEEAKQLVCKTKVRLKQDDLNMFNWELTDSDQGIFDTKMMVFLWFKEEVTPVMRQKVLNDTQQGFTSDLLPFKGVYVRATPELDQVKRPWNKAQAIFIGVMKEHANVAREAFDIK